jgi:hypothetical protein
MEQVTGVGSQPIDKVYTGKAVAGSGSQTFDITSFVGRGLIRYLGVLETGGAVTATYDIEFYGRDTFLATDLLYKATGIDPATLFTDSLPWWIEDFDLTNELHMKIINSDAAGATFTVTLKGEAFG